MAGRYINITPESIAALEKWDAFVTKWYTAPRDSVRSTLIKGCQCVFSYLRLIRDTCVEKIRAITEYFIRPAAAGRDA